MFQILGHSNLSHESVLVAVHACHVTHVTEDILEPISQLERLNLA